MQVDVKRHNRGFTLIELMVSVTIFAIVMVMALGSLLSISTADRKAESLKSVMDNLNFALDSMSRTIRTGLYYSCMTSPSFPVSLDSNGNPIPANCAGGATAIAFHSADGNTVVYCRGSNSACSSSGSSILRSTDGGNTFTQLTASEVVVNNLNFYVIGACATPGTPPSGSCADSSYDYVQPKVTITVNGQVKVTGSQNTTYPYAVQTTVTQRVYDQ
jgi:prepilin-type N-terminal cleavage/methylation domain-containing protein